MIELRRLTTADVSAAKQLWRLRFDDGDAFIDWYFSTYFCPQTSIGLFDEEELLSMAHGRLMKMRLYERALPVWMVSGVSTKPGYEKRGYMHLVMQKLLYAGAEDGVPLAFNHPVRLDAYEKLGFVPFTELLLWHGEGADQMDVPLAREPISAKRLLTIYQAATKAYQGCIYRSERDMERRLADHFSDGGRCLMTEQGYSLYYLDEQELRAEETLSIGSPLPLIAKLKHLAAGRKLTVKLPADLPLPGERKPWQVIAVTDGKLLKTLLPAARELPFDEPDALAAAVFGITGQKKACYCAEEY